MAIVSEEIRALEFFSGIGGMHYGLEWSGVKGEVVASFDISPVPNECYKHNFQISPIQTGIEHITPKYLAPFRANAWFMSPPCQPYTRMGKQRDDQDPRAKGLLHLIDLLGTIADPPSYIFMENVLNFEKSRSRDRLISQLIRLNYTYTEWMLTPTQLGIPNDRMRYYLTARRSNTSIPRPPTTSDLETTIAPPPELKDSWPYDSPFGPDHRKDLGYYLEDGIDIDGDSPWKVPDAFVRTRSFFSEFVIAKPTDTRTCCFTKAYGHHGLGAGAFLQTHNFGVLPNLDNPAEAAELLGLRFFTPEEIARLHAFPIDERAPRPPASTIHTATRHGFAFPPGLSRIQRYRVLGNSMNVAVVGELMRCALFSEQAAGEVPP